MIRRERRTLVKVQDPLHLHRVITETPPARRHRLHCALQHRDVQERCALVVHRRHGVALDAALAVWRQDPELQVLK